MSEHDDDDNEPTPEELAEAEALARALEPPRRGVGPAAAPAPEDALSTAGLLRAAAAPQLAPARLAAAAARAQAAVDARRPARRRWLFPALLVPAAAAAALVFSVTARRPPPAWPAPSLALLEEQARAARGHADLAALDRQMREYRAAYLAALAQEDRR